MKLEITIKYNFSAKEALNFISSSKEERLKILASKQIEEFIYYPIQLEQLRNEALHDKEYLNLLIQDFNSK